VTELEKVNRALRDKNSENESLRVQISEVRASSRSSEALQQEIRSLQDLLSIRNSQLEELQREATQRLIYEPKLKEYETKFAMLSTEIERLNLLLRERMEENDSMKLKLLQVEPHLRDRELLEKEKAKLKELLVEKMQKTEELQDRLNRLQNDRRLDESQLVGIRFLEEENQRLRKDLNDRNKMIEESRGSFARLEVAFRERERLMEENAMLQTQLLTKGGEAEQWRQKFMNLELAGSNSGYKNEINLLKYNIEIKLKYNFYNFFLYKITKMYNKFILTNRCVAE
jgi:predicted RNase H-like nuclease (RuvC/YqgF family)